MYLNQVYWGHNAYGIESASQMYFGKHAKDLTLAESAGLVGMLKGPELFSPFKYFDRFNKYFFPGIFQTCSKNIPRNLLKVVF